MSEINKTMNGAVKNLKADILKELSKVVQPGGADPAHVADPMIPGAPGEGAPDPKGEAKGGVDPVLNARIQSMEKAQKQLQEKLTAAEKKAEEELSQRLESERLATVTGIIGNLQFANEESKDLFYSGIVGKVKRADDGAYIVESENGPFPARQYIESLHERMPNLQAAIGRVGSGAAPPRRGSSILGFDLDNIRPGMTAEELAAASAEIARNLSQPGH
ncbi:MAG: hypothetical protein ACRD2O_15890 [Terriglobia bacterium]